MNLFKNLERVLESTKPGPSLTFMEVHVLEALRLIGFEEGIGRIRLARKLDLGEGVTRTLLKRLKKQMLITVDPKLGCKLTAGGRKIYRFMESKVTETVEVPKNPVTLGAYNVGVMVRKAAGTVKYGLEQRDAALRVGGTGATTLIFKQNRLLMPGIEEDCFKNAPEVLRMLVESFHPEEGDVIIIGSGESEASAQLSAKAAAFQTLKQLQGETSS